MEILDKYLNNTEKHQLKTFQKENQSKKSQILQQRLLRSILKKKLFVDGNFVIRIRFSFTKVISGKKLFI